MKVSKIIILTVIGLGILGFFLPDTNTPSDKKEAIQSKWKAKVKVEPKCDKLDAFAGYLELLPTIKRKLKSPSTADLASLPQQEYYDGDCTFSFISYVDAMNGFGATIRTKWYGKVKRNPKTETWTILNTYFFK